MNSVDSCRIKVHGHVRHVDEAVAPDGATVEFDTVVEVIMLDRYEGIGPT